MPTPTPDFSSVKDKSLRKKLEGVVADHQASKREIPKEVDQRPQFVFSRATPDRTVGAPVRIRNGLDEDPCGGTILEKLGRAYLVDIGHRHVIVHEPDDSW